MNSQTENKIEVLSKSPFLKRLIDYPRPSLIECFDEDNKAEKEKAVIILTGGGYNVYGEGEGFPVAKVFKANGYLPFILCYSLGENNPFPTQMRELAQAVSHVRENYNSYSIDPDDIIVCGLSAGGHLAASLGIHGSSNWTKEYSIPSNGRPNRLILGYPATGEVEGGNARTFATLEANISDADLVPYIYLDESDVSQMPPTFIWHNEDDTVIPVKCTNDFEKALVEKNVSHEVHYFPKGGHRVNNNDPGLESALRWLKKDV